MSLHEEPTRHFAPYGSTNAACDETVPRSTAWDTASGEYADGSRFTTRRARVTCSECAWVLARHPEPAHEPNPNSGPDVPPGYFCKCGRPWALCELWSHPRADAVRTLHVPLDAECTAIGHRPEPHSCPDLVTLCAECGKDYPCPTINALDAAQLQVQAPVGEGLENGASDGEREALLVACDPIDHHIAGDGLPAMRVRSKDEIASRVYAAGYRKTPVVNVEDVARVIEDAALATYAEYPDGSDMSDEVWDSRIHPVHMSQSRVLAIEASPRAIATAALALFNGEES